MTWSKALIFTTEFIVTGAWLLVKMQQLCLLTIILMLPHPIFISTFVDELFSHFSG